MSGLNGNGATGTAPSAQQPRVRRSYTKGSAPHVATRPITRPVDPRPGNSLVSKILAHVTRACGEIARNARALEPFDSHLTRCKALAVRAVEVAWLGDFDSEQNPGDGLLKKELDDAGAELKTARNDEKLAEKAAVGARKEVPEPQAEPKVFDLMWLVPWVTLGFSMMLTFRYVEPFRNIGLDYPALAMYLALAIGLLMSGVMVLGMFKFQQYHPDQPPPKPVDPVKAPAPPEGPLGQAVQFFKNTLPATILLIVSVAGLRAAPMAGDPLGTLGVILAIGGIEIAQLMYVYPAARHAVRRRNQWEDDQHDRDKKDRHASTLEAHYEAAKKRTRDAAEAYTRARKAYQARLDHAFDLEGVHALAEDAAIGAYLAQVDANNADYTLEYNAYSTTH